MGPIEDSLEYKLSENILNYLDELMTFMDDVEDRELGNLQKQIIMNNNLDNVNSAAQKYLNSDISDWDRYNSILIQTTTVLKDAYQRIEPEVGDLSKIRDTLRINANQWIIKIVNARATSDFNTISQTSHMIGEFLNSADKIKNFKKTPISSDEKYLEKYLRQFDLLKSMAYTHAESILKIKLLPTNWVKDWSGKYFYYIKEILTYLDGLNLIKIYTIDSTTAQHFVYSVIELYTHIVVFSYRLMALYGQDWNEEIELYDFTYKSGLQGLQEIIFYCKDQISNLYNKLLDLNQRRQISLPTSTSHDVSLEFIDILGKTIKTIGTTIKVVEEIQSSRISRFTNEYEQTLSKVIESLKPFQEDNEILEHVHRTLLRNIEGISEILINQLVILNYQKITNEIKSPKSIQFEQIKELSAYSINDRTNIVFTQFFTYIGIKADDFEIEKWLLDYLNAMNLNSNNPLDKIAVEILTILLKIDTHFQTSTILEKSIKKIIDYVNSAMAISHLRGEITGYLNNMLKLLKNETQFKLKRWESKRNIVDPISWVIPKIKSSISIRYEPYNKYQNYLLPEMNIT